jgi:hypothetical protein
MDQLKFSIGPYELFSSIIAGFPILFAIYILYKPMESLRDIVPIIRDNSSFSITITIITLSYLFGGLSTAFTWKYFLFICEIFKLDYSYMGKKIIEKMTKVENSHIEGDIESLDFEDRLIYLLIQKIGAVKRLSMLDARLISYLRVHSIQSASIAESHLAIHIMYRTLSFGFLLLSLVLIINLFRMATITFEQIILPIFSALLSFAAFRMAITFRRWRNREIVLSFYHLANGEYLKNSQPKSFG